ncbi:hypothetical protein Bca4012_026427 [Brassica carinata]
MEENWGKLMRSLARMIWVHLIRDRAEFEEREVTQHEFDVAYDLKEVMYWVSPLQLEGTSISTLELQLEEICLPCGENIAHDLDSLELINEFLDLICETTKLDELRIEKLFFILNEPRPLLALADLEDELDVDKLLLEIENPHAENYHENVNIVFYLVDGDRVDYFVKTSFAPV